MRNNLETVLEKRRFLDQAVSAKIRKQEREREEEYITVLLTRLRKAEELRYNRFVSRTQKEHEAILELIDRKAEEIRLLQLRLPLKTRYMEMEEKNIETETRYRWKKALSDLLKAYEEGNE